jgi:hypothetical protein
MIARRTMLLSLAAVALAACGKRSHTGPLTADEPVDTGFTGCTA